MVFPPWAKSGGFEVNSRWFWQILATNVGDPVEQVRAVRAFFANREFAMLRHAFAHW